PCVSQDGIANGVGLVELLDDSDDIHHSDLEGRLCKRSWFSQSRFGKSLLLIRGHPVGQVSRRKDYHDCGQNVQLLFHLRTSLSLADGMEQRIPSTITGSISGNRLPPRPRCLQ